jgi:hypothetical protein
VAPPNYYTLENSGASSVESDSEEDDDAAVNKSIILINEFILGQGSPHKFYTNFQLYSWLIPSPQLSKYEHLRYPSYLTKTPDPHNTTNPHNSSKRHNVNHKLL